MSLYFNVDDVDDLINRAYEITPNSPEFEKFIMKLICSFGKSRRLTQYGIQIGEELWNKKEPLTRKELMMMVFVMTELSMLKEGVDEEKLSIYHNMMNKKYSPEEEYLKQYAQEHLLQEGIVEVNPNYIPMVEREFMGLLDVFDK